MVYCPPIPIPTTPDKTICMDASTRQKLHTCWKLLFGFLTALLVSQSAHAAYVTWTGNDNNGSWTDNNNWSAAISGNAGVFVGSTGTTVTVGSNFTQNLILFDTSGVGSYTIESGTFTSGGAQIGSTSGTKASVDITTAVTTLTGTETIDTPLTFTATTGFANDATSSGFVLDIAGNVAGSGVINLAGDNTGNNTISGVVSGATSLDVGAFAGANGYGASPGSTTPVGNWIVTNVNNSFTGGVIMLGGTLSAATIGNMGADSTIGTSGTITYGGSPTSSAGGGTFSYIGTGETSNKAILISSDHTGNFVFQDAGTGLLNITGTVSGAGTTNTQTLVIQGSTAGVGEISGPITSGTYSSGGKLALTKLGTGTWILSGSNSYQGITQIEAGTVEFATENSLYGYNQSDWTSSNFIVGSSATAAFDVGGSGQFTQSDIATLLGLATNGLNGFANGSTLGIDTTGGNFTWSTTGIVNPHNGSNVLGLAKLGSNSLTLSTTNSYTGATTVSAGTLIVSGSLTGTTAVSVAGGATLSVDGLIKTATTITDTGGLVQGQGTVGAVNITLSGTLAPGLSTANGNAGTLTSVNGVSLDSSSAFDVRLGVSSATDHDELLVTTGSSVTLGNSTLNITLGSNIAGAPLHTFYNIIFGGYNSNSPTYFGNTAEAGGIGTITDGGYEFEVIYGSDGTTDGAALVGNDVSLEDLGAIPEPDTWASLVAGAGFLLIVRRRRYRK